MDHFSFIDVEAAEQREERRAARNASLIFHQRAAERFEGFLRQAAHKDEFDARVSLIEGDLGRLATEVREEFEAGALLLESAFIERIAGGAFCDDCRKWKSGPKSLCTCADESKNDQGLMEDAPSAVGGKESSVKVACECNNGDACRCDSDCKDCACEKKSSKVAFHIVADSPDGKKFSCPGCGRQGTYQLGKVNPFRDIASGQKCESCYTPVSHFKMEGEDGFGEREDPWGKRSSESTGLSDEPSGPKLDKSKGGDWRGYDHTEVPVKSGDKQDVADSADYDKDYSEKMEDVTKLHKEEKGPHTKTWTGTEGQADPVTSHFLSSDAISRALAQS